MSKVNTAMLDALLADKDAEFFEWLEKNAPAKDSEPKGLNLNVETVDEAVVNAGVALYEQLRDSWLEIAANQGMTTEEARRFAYLRGPKEDPARPKGRTFKSAVGDMKVAYRDLLDEYTAEINKKFPSARLSAQDVMSRIQFPQIMTRVMELPMMAPLEPVYAIQGLFKSLAVPDMFGDAARFTFPILGALTAHEMGEDAEAQEKDLDLAGGAMLAKFAKVGVGFKYSQDFQKFANFDWYGLVISACRQALARMKEVKAYSALTRNGTTVIDNRGRFGMAGAIDVATVGTAGTGVDGLRNGTHVLQDIFYMMTAFNEQGYYPDTIVLSPRAWLIWAQSPEMRAFAWQNGMPQMWQMPQGQFGRVTEHEVFNGILGSHTDHPRGSSTYTTPPNFLPLPLRIVVSPFVESGTDANSIEYTNAHMLDVSSGIGYLMQTQDVMMSQWNDPEHDLDKVRFTERYAFGVLQDSKTIKHMKGLKTREIGVDARDKIWFGVNWAGGVGGPHIGNV